MENPNLYLIAIKVNEKRDIAVLTKTAGKPGKPDGPAKVSMTTPSKKKVEVPLKETPEGFVGQIVPTEVGPHTVDVTCAGNPVPQSPFNVSVVPGADLSKVKVTGLDKRKWWCIENVFNVVFFLEILFLEGDLI